MSILIDSCTRLIVQGITGREGSFHTEQMLGYGTKIIGGVTPGKGGQAVCGVPVYNTVREAVEAAEAAEAADTVETANASEAADAAEATDAAEAADAVETAHVAANMVGAASVVGAKEAAGTEEAADAIGSAGTALGAPCGVDASVLFVPARFLAASVNEAVDAGVPLIIMMAEYVPVHDMMLCYHTAKARGARLIGPNSFGIISPGKSKAGFMDHRIFSPGPVGIMSRSATNCYETASMLTSRGIGQSTCIGVGGDIIPGSTFVDLLPDFENDPQTQAIVMIGEIGGDSEEAAAEYIKNHVTKPVVALIVGKSAPRGAVMGHAGAIVGAGGKGGAEGKEKALLAAGCHIAQSTAHIAEILADL